MSLWVSLIEGPCPHCGQGERVYDSNITHNLGEMASEGGMYEKIWRPETSGVDTAQDLIYPLQTFIAEMEREPERFKAHNATNGWGLYEHFLPWLKAYLEACEENPTAKVRASR